MLNQTESNDSRPVHPRRVFFRARDAYRQLSEVLDLAEMQLGGAEALLDLEFHPRVPSPFRAAVEGNVLSGRVGLICLLVAERALSLGEGLAAEIEANRLFPAASVARSLMELVGRLVHLRGQLTLLRSADPPNLAALRQETVSFLLASRSLDLASVPPLVRLNTPSMINAAKARFGEAFGQDYGFLSDIAHPNASAAFGLLGEEEASILTVIRRPPITEHQAEVLVKVLAIGLQSVDHDVLNLMEWASNNDLSLLDI